MLERWKISLTSSSEESSVYALFWPFEVPAAFNKVVYIDPGLGGAESRAVGSRSNTLASKPRFRHLAHGAKCSSNLVNVAPVQHVVLANLLDFLVREHGDTYATWYAFWSRSRTFFYFESCFAGHIRSKFIITLIGLCEPVFRVLVDLDPSSVNWFGSKCDLLPLK